VEIGSRSSEQLTKFNNNDLALSKGSPLPFEVKGSRPVLPQHWVVFFQPEADQSLSDKEYFFREALLKTRTLLLLSHCVTD
jgi:hypothetical protein